METSASVAHVASAIVGSTRWVLKSGPSHAGEDPSLHSANGRPMAAAAETTPMAEDRPTRSDRGKNGSAGFDQAEGPTAADVAENYDFEDFGPADLRAMDLEEWEAAFDPDSWVTGPDLLDRVEDELRSRVADREVFAVIERTAPDRLLAYSDEGFARVDADGGVTGSGTVLRDVKPTVALCSMPEYEVAEPPADASLPEPAAVPEGGGQLGNWMLQAIAASMILAGVVLLGATLLTNLGAGAIVAVVAGLAFLAAGVFLFATVANARLAGRFRAEEFRNRLRAAGVDEAERPAILEEFDPERTPDDE
jgi:hypothetical protein